MDDITKKDLYEFLGVGESSTENEIRKAYRQKALSCHPDKNPDNPAAVDLFRQYTKATEILLDTEARKAYDKVLRARRERSLRNAHLDGDRKKLKDALEAREKAARDGREKEIDEALLLAKEIERLRKEGSRKLEEENDEIRRQVEKELATGRAGFAKHQETECKVKVSWDGHIDTDKLKSLFERFGSISNFILSPKGKSALIVYPDQSYAIRAKNSPLTSGFTVSILDGNLDTSLIKEATSSMKSDNYEESVLEKLRRKAREQTSK